MHSPDQSNAHGSDANTTVFQQPEPAQAGEQQKEPGTWRGVLILCAICALLIGGIAIFAWQSKAEDFFDDARIAGTEKITMTVPGTGEDEGLFLIKLVDGLTAEEIKRLLADIHDHNMDSENELISGYTLATADGRPIWNLDDRFLLFDASIESIEVAQWLAEQNKPISWSTNRNDRGSSVSISTDENYTDLSFLREVMAEFPTIRAAISHRDAPYVNLAAGTSELTQDVEKAIDAWYGEPAKYGDITRFYIPDFTENRGKFFNYLGREIEHLELNVKFQVSDDDPMIRKLLQSASYEQRNKTEEERRRDIRDTLTKEGRTIVPDLAITFS